MNCQVLIVGGGPAGLGAALLLNAMGWRDIVVVERRAASEGFDRGRAFNYQLEGRGQRLLERVGIEQSTISRYGLPNDHFTLTKLMPDGTTSTMQPPILVPGRKTPYWMTRSRLLALLHEALEPVIERGAVTLLDGHTFEAFQVDGDTHHAVIANATASTDATPLKLQPTLVLACDGLSSAVRQALLAVDPGTAPELERIVHPSPAADLAYKVLSMPPSFTANDGRTAVNDHTMAYAFLSTYRDPKERMSLFALPVATPEDPRSINIILPKDHRFWSLTDPNDVEAFLTSGFPQIDVRAVAGPDEFASFVAARPGQFPQPQYTRRIYHSLPGANGRTMHCVLLGDAAHAFPPDLGMGVNSALEDVAELESYLEQVDRSAALRAYAAAREPEHASLVRLVQTVHPYQYNQTPWRLKLWTARFLAQLLVHKATFGLIDMPGFMLSQRHTMAFTEMERRYRAGNRAMSLLGLGALAGAGYLAFF
ncbi:MAG: FAD-dependent monooxygenase [Pseudomonadota bacterium]